ncbi:MMPL family transporter [Streptomyces sp. NPDC002920]
MVVFGSFVFVDMQVTKGMGLALAGGVLLDAFVVRTLPHVDVEGEKLTSQPASPAAEPGQDKDLFATHR